MLRYHQAIVLLLLGLILCTCGCLRKTLTDEAIIDAVQAYLDTPPDPAGENLLTAEEHAVIQGFQIYRNIIKVQLVDDTEQPFWRPVGKKLARVFGLACREAGQYEHQYLVELRVRTEVDGRVGNFKIADVTFDNQSEQVIVELYNPVWK